MSLIQDSKAEAIRKVLNGSFHDGYPSIHERQKATEYLDDLVRINAELRLALKILQRKLDEAKTELERREPDPWVMPVPQVEKTPPEGWGG